MKKINKIIFVIAAICLGMILLRGASFSQQAAGELFEKALYVEEGQGDLQKALGLYQDILKRFPESREVAAKAQLRIGFCYEKLGIKEAEKAFQQVIDNYPEQSGTVREAQEKLKTLARAQTPSEKNPVGLTLRKIWSGELDITARISPDGRSLARTNWTTGDLSILDIATGKARNLTDKGPFTKSPEFAITMAWSPDGKHIAYGWMKAPNDVEVRLVSLDNPVPRTIFKVDHPELEGPFPIDWTPDGKAVLINIEEVKGPKWYGAGGKIGLVSVADGSVRILKDLGSVENWRGGIFSPRISPDGRWIAYSFQTGDPPNCDIFLLSADGKKEGVLVEHPAQDSFFGWAPDGNSILFSSDRTGALDAYVLRVKDGKAVGQPELVKKDIGEASPHGISRDGTFYYMVTKGAENVYLVRFDPDRKKILDQPPAPVPHLGGTSHSPAFSPDGKSLAFVSERGIQFRVRPVLCVRSLETGKDREFRPEISGLKQLRWSPDGSSILFLATPEDNHSQVCSINMGTGQVTIIFRCGLPNMVEGIESADWSRDGRSIYYVLRNYKEKVSRLLVRECEKGSENELFRGPQGETQFGTALSPDGKQLAILFRSWDPVLDVILRIMPVGGGEPRDLHKFGSAANVGHIAWTPDGKAILAAVTIGEKNTRSLWRVSADSGAAEDLGLGMPIKRISIHPDGRQIAVSSPGPTPQMPELWMMENFLPAIKK
jgi:Tol biopolymer transport system component